MHMKHKKSQTEHKSLLKSTACSQKKAPNKISTSRFGLGEEKNSFCTPRGMHIIRAMIGHNCPINTNFVGRRVVEKSKIESKFHSSIPYFRFRYIFYDSMLITTCKIPVASGFFQIPDYRLPLVSPDSSAEIPDSSTPERFALLFFYWATGNRQKLLYH